jgi:flagellar motor component MotA
MAVASFVSMLIVAFGGTAEFAAQVTALIIAGATIVAYILGQSWCDVAETYRDAEKDSIENYDFKHGEPVRKGK